MSDREMSHGDGVFDEHSRTIAHIVERRGSRRMNSDRAPSACPHCRDLAHALLIWVLVPSSKGIATTDEL